MVLEEQIGQHRDAILGDWFDRILAGYPTETAKFLRSKKDPFGNPVGTGLRDELEATAGKARVIVFSCDVGDAQPLENEATKVFRVPCVGMVPPSFVDFALARGYAEGVMIAGCAECDCHHRLGNEWTIGRMARQ